MVKKVLDWLAHPNAVHVARWAWCWVWAAQIYVSLLNAPLEEFATLRVMAARSPVEMSLSIVLMFAVIFALFDVARWLGHRLVALTARFNVWAETSFPWKKEA